MSRKKFKIRKPSKFNISAATYFAEKEEGVEVPVNPQYLRDPRLTREDGGKMRAVMYGDDLKPVFA